MRWWQKPGHHNILTRFFFKNQRTLAPGSKPGRTRIKPEEMRAVDSSAIRVVSATKNISAKKMRRSFPGIISQMTRRYIILRPILDCESKVSNLGVLCAGYRLKCEGALLGHPEYDSLPVGNYLEKKASNLEPHGMDCGKRESDHPIIGTCRESVSFLAAGQGFGGVRDETGALPPRVAGRSNQNERMSTLFPHAATFSSGDRYPHPKAFRISIEGRSTSEYSVPIGDVPQSNATMVAQGRD